MSKTFYLTTAIDYVNSVPHIGTAYEKIGADVIARFQRMRGVDVHFQMGNDEHSLNVKRSADEKGLDPLEYCDEMEKKFVDAWKSLEISYDDFIRTTDPKHKTSVQRLFQTILDNGDIYQDTYEGWYCESCEAFLTDKDLEDGKCPNHKKKPEWLKEYNYFFALSKYGDKLLKHIKKNPEFILPSSRRNEIISLIESGLQDVSVSRSSMEWGISLPQDGSHVVYVWFDALINYITAVGFGTDDKMFKKWWPASVHMIGKDITRFHCVIWPAMLMAAKIPLPKTIFAHGFVYLKGEKMSKSLGNVVTPLDITKDFGPDPLRYFLLRETPFGKDTDFTWEAFINRYNGDLANGIGNLISRTVGMAKRYLNGEIPKYTESSDKTDVELKNRLKAIPYEYEKAFEMTESGITMNMALAHIWEGITAADKYINENKPWELQKKGNTDRIKIVIANVAEAVRILTVLMNPFIPGSAEKIWKAFGLDNIAKLESQSFKDTLKWGFLNKPVQIGESENLFPRIEDKKEEPKTPEKKEKEKKMDDNLIDIMDFAKVELKVAEIKEAEAIEGADKLLKLIVDIGNDETRQIVAGIAKSYQPDELVGKKVAVVTNLKPAKLRGVESQGMLLAASCGDDVTVITPLRDMPAGSRIK